MATQEEINQVALDNRTFINSLIANSKLPSELASKSSITSSADVAVVQNGLSDAEKVDIALTRGSLGGWNASTNAPSLVNGTGIGGDKYIVTAAGTQDFGAGSVTFLIDDFVEYANGEWVKGLNVETAATAADNEGVVNSASNFPAPVANVITLVGGIAYRVSGEIDIGDDRFDTSAGNIILFGENPNTDKILTTTTGALFTGSSIRCRNVGATVASGDIFDMSGLGVISLSGFFVFGCENIGTVNATGLFNWMNSNITAMSVSGLLFTGVCRSILIQSCSFSDFEGVGIDLGTATASLLRMDGNRLSGNVGATSIDVAPSSANIIALGEGWITNNLFNGDGDATVGTDPGDASWTYHNNSGDLASSFRGADGHILGNSTETVISTINTPVPVNFNSSFIGDLESSFTVDSDGCFTYIAATPIAVSGTASIFGDSASGTNIRYRFYFAKNDVVDIGSVAEDQFNSSDPHSTSISAIDQIVTGDKLCLWVECTTGTTNITIETASIHVIGN